MKNPLRAPLRAMFAASEPHVPRNPADDRWFGMPTGTAEIVVNAQTVQQIPEVFACLNVLAQTIGTLPLITYRRLPGGGKERADRHPIADLLHHQPNKLQTAYEFRAQMTWDLAIHRNAFAEIKSGRRGSVDQLVRLAPETVWLRTSETQGSHVYEVREGAGRVRRLLPEEVFHIRAAPLTSNNLLGRSIIEDGARTFARALALHDYATRFFQNDATPGGVITVPMKWPTVDAAKEFRDKWMAQFTGANRHKPALLDGGATFHKFDVQNDKAQFLETYKECALQLLRLWRMPPHKVGILDRATFSNIEQQSLEFVVDTLLPWLVAWEQAISRDLIHESHAYFCEHNLEGLLRGDVKSRYEAYRIGREWGWLNVDDIRRRENMNPLGGAEGTTYLQPMNMAPAGAPPRTDGPTRAAFEAYVTREVTAAMDARRIGTDAVR